MSKYGGVLQEGILKKKAGNDLAWNTHYAVLAADSCLRLYHSIDAARECSKSIGRITHSQMDKVFLIPETMITYDDSEHFKFAVVSTSLGRQWQFAAPSQDEANRWVKTLNSTANASRRKASKASLGNLSRMPSVEQTTSSSGRKKVEVVDTQDLSSASSLSGKDLFDDESSAFSPGRRQPSSSSIYRGHSKGKISLGRADMAKEMGNLLIEDLKETSAELSQYSLESAGHGIDEFDPDEFRSGLHYSLRKPSGSSRASQFRLSSVGDPSDNTADRKVTERDITSLHNLSDKTPALEDMIASIHGLDTRVSNEWVKSSYQGSLEMKNESAQMLGKHTWNKHYCRLCTHALIIYSGDSDTVESKVKLKLAKHKQLVREAEDEAGKIVSDEVIETDQGPKSEITQIIWMDSLVGCHSRVDKSSQKRFDLIYYDSQSLTQYLSNEKKDKSEVGVYGLGCMKLLSLRAESEIMRNHWCKQLILCQRRHWQSLRDCLEMIGLFEYHLLNYTAEVDAKGNARDGAATSNASLMDLQAMIGVDVSSALVLKGATSASFSESHEYIQQQMGVAEHLAHSDEQIVLELPEKKIEIEEISNDEARETNNLNILTPEELVKDLTVSKTDPLADDDHTRRVKQINSRNHTVWEKETRLMFSWRFSGIQDSNAVQNLIDRHKKKRMSVGKRSSQRLPSDLISSEADELISPIMIEDPTTPGFAETIYLTPGMIDTVRSSSLRSRPLSILNIDDEIITNSARKSVMGSDSAPVLVSSITLEGPAMIELGSPKANALLIRIGNDDEEEEYENDSDVKKEDSESKKDDTSEDELNDSDPKYDKIENDEIDDFEVGHTRTNTNTTNMIYLSISQDILVIKRNEKDNSPLISLSLEIVKSVHRLGREGLKLSVSFHRELFGVEYYGRRSTVTVASPKSGNDNITDMIGLITNDDWRITFSSTKNCSQWFNAMNRCLKETCMVKESIYNEMYHLRMFIDNLIESNKANHDANKDPPVASVSSYSSFAPSLKINAPLGFEHINRSLKLLGDITVLMPYLLLNIHSDDEGSHDGLKLGIALQNRKDSNSCCNCCNTCVCVIL